LSILENDLIEIIEKILECDLSVSRSRAEIPQWDSMKQVEIIFTLEDKYLIEFSEHEMEELTSIDRILKVLENKKQVKGG